MLMGTLVYGIRYTFPEYLCTFLVAGGVSTFEFLKVRNSSKTGQIILVFSSYRLLISHSVWEFMWGVNATQLSICSSLLMPICRLAWRLSASWHTQMLSLGYWLCFLNLVFDGFTNATHDSLKARWCKTNISPCMLQFKFVWFRLLHFQTFFIYIFIFF